MNTNNYEYEYQCSFKLVHLAERIFRNTIVLVFCSNFNSDGCNNPPYEADEDGFYRGVHFPCKHFTGNFLVIKTSI